MKSPNEYDCIGRFTGRCDNCAKDKLNLYCPRYYPIHVIGSEGLLEPPEIARVMKERLKELLK
jgi:hypothetical protein